AKMDARIAKGMSAARTPQGANCAPSGGSAAAEGRKRGGAWMDMTAIDKRTMGRWALTGVAGATFGFILLPLIFVTWLAFFQQAIPSFPPQGYSLKWFFSITENPKFVDGFVLSLQVAVVATVIGVVIGVPAALCVARYRFWGREPLGNLLLLPLVVPGIVLGTSLYVFHVEATMLT